MEKMSSIDRVVGKVPEATKKEILTGKQERFDDQVFEELKGKEREKTPEELQIISMANDATNELRRKYGLENFDIPPKNFHIIAKEAWPHADKAAFYNSGLQAVAQQERPEKIVRLKNTMHEMVHFKSYHALQVTMGENPHLSDYHEGLTITSRDGEKTYFTNLDEAVTEELTKKLSLALFDNPLFAEERQQTKTVVEQYSHITTGSGEPLFDENTYYANIKDRAILTSNFTYSQERKILNTLIDRIFEKNPEKFQGKEEVFEVFAKGMMTGNIWPLGKLIDKTFGRGTFRKIGEMDSNIEAQENFVKSLSSDRTMSLKENFANQQEEDDEAMMSLAA